MSAASISKYSFWWVRLCKQWKYMKKTNKLQSLLLPRDTNPGHDSACCVHMARGSITSHHFGLKWTCLFWLVQRIINVSPSSPPPHTSSTDIPVPQLCLNKSKWLVAPVNVITYKSEIMSHPPTPGAAISLERSVGVLKRDTFWFERAETAAPVRGQTGRADVTSHRSFCHSVSQRKTARMLIRNQRGLFSSSSHLHGCETEKRWNGWKQKMLI